MAKTKHKTDGAQKLITVNLIALVAIVVLVIVLNFVYTSIRSFDDTEEYRNLWWLGTLIQSLGFLLYALLALLVVFTFSILNANRKATGAQLKRIESLLENQGREIHNLTGLAKLPDQTKALIYHERELQALRESVHAMLLKRDYASAEALIARVESCPDLTEETARLRKDVEFSRTATVDDKVVTATQQFHKFLERREWAQAKREAERLETLFPNNPQIAALPSNIRGAWIAHKHELLKEYGEACRVNNVEKSIELLKKLDKYLTPQEGEALAESARDVFKKKLHNLGVQFAIAVTDQQWSSAVTTGEEIIREYPNSRMAHEVLEKLDLLRDYASGVLQPSISIIDQPDSPFGPEGDAVQPPPKTDEMP